MSFSRQATFRILDDTHLELLEWDRTYGKYVETGRIFTIVGEKEGVQTFVKNLNKTVNISEEVSRDEVKIVENHDPDLLRAVREPVLDKPVVELPAVAPEKFEVYAREVTVGDGKVTEGTRVIEIAAGAITAEKVTAGTIQLIPEGGSPKLVGEETKPKKERKQKQEKTGETK